MREFGDAGKRGENKKDSIPDGGTLSGNSGAIGNMVGKGCKVVLV